MALSAKHNETDFGVGDTIRVTQRIKEGDRERAQAFEGIVIGIKGRQENKMFTVRRIGAQQIGIERIFTLDGPSLEKIEVVRIGLPGIKRAKLNYIKTKSKREIEKIYSRATSRIKSKEASKLTKKTKSSKSSK